mmetsp:Transcript_15986/g.41499  ORF Transcript_15986/g.41499 Transcript_15986/m.41499 type:complete len:233 (-) Transcript_15986:8-706(-)
MAWRSAAPSTRKVSVLSTTGIDRARAAAMGAVLRSSAAAHSRCCSGTLSSQVRGRHALPPALLILPRRADCASRSRESMPDSSRTPSSAVTCERSSCMPPSSSLSSPNTALPSRACVWPASIAACDSRLRRSRPLAASTAAAILLSHASGLSWNLSRSPSLRAAAQCVCSRLVSLLSSPCRLLILDASSAMLVRDVSSRSSCFFSSSARMRSASSELPASVYSSLRSFAVWT